MADASPEFVQVAIDVPVRTTFTYRLPEHLRGRVSVGHRLYVPFRGRPRTGVATGLEADAGPFAGDESAIKPVLEILDAEPILPEALVHLLDWVARYYFAPPGEVLRLMLPRPLRVRGHRKARLTAFGADCLKNEMVPDAVEQRALAALEAAPRPINDSTLRRRVKRLTLAKLASMAERNLIALEIAEPARLKGRQLVKYLRRTDRGDDERLGAKQRAVLNALEGRDRVLLDEVRSLTSASAATLRALRQRGLIEELHDERYRDPFVGEPIRHHPPVELTREQRAAAEHIIGDGRFENFRSVVLHGITGSGKTEVYLQAIGAALRVGRRALVLLPEIALTPQLVAVFRARLGNAIAVLHSGLDDGQRFDQWRQIRRSEIQVVIGARSAIFAPLEGLGVLVVDEEHDGSFKQDTGVRYHARDLALVRAQHEGATVVLGSATPSLESIHRVSLGKSRLVRLTRRPTGQPLPTVEVVDMRLLPRRPDGKPPLLSPDLRDALSDMAQAGQQGILFLNRRGHSPIVICQTCGTSRDCPHCEISLTYHRRQDALRCHYCDYRERMPERCTSCDGGAWAWLGAGTEKLADQLDDELVGLRTLRLDRDTAKKGQLRRILTAFREHRADILVGTQMVTKGHDFPRVTLVGVVMADLSLRIPDFRSGERTFQLLAQVAGRAGRRDEPGRVIIQTYMPEHAAIRAALRHDHAGFADVELATRQALAYPPYGHLIALHFEGPDLDELGTVTARYAQGAKRALAQVAGSGPGVSVLGPVESPLGRLRGRYRWQMLAKSVSRQHLRAFIGHLLAAASFGAEPAAVSVAVDVDPMHLL